MQRRGKCSERQERSEAQRKAEERRMADKGYVEHVPIKHALEQFPFVQRKPQVPSLKNPGYVLVEPAPPGSALYSPDAPFVPKPRGGFFLRLTTAPLAHTGA